MKLCCNILRITSQRFFKVMVTYLSVYDVLIESSLDNNECVLYLILVMSCYRKVESLYYILLTTLTHHWWLPWMIKRSVCWFKFDWQINLFEVQVECNLMKVQLNKRNFWCYSTCTIALLCCISNSTIQH